MVATLIFVNFLFAVNFIHLKNGAKNKSAIAENLERLEWFGILLCHEEGQIKYWQHIEIQQAS